MVPLLPSYCLSRRMTMMSRASLWISQTSSTSNFKLSSGRNISEMSLASSTRCEAFASKLNKSSPCSSGSRCCKSSRYNSNSHQALLASGTNCFVSGFRSPRPPLPATPPPPSSKSSSSSSSSMPAAVASSSSDMAAPTAAMLPAASAARRRDTRASAAEERRSDTPGGGIGISKKGRRRGDLGAAGSRKPDRPRSDIRPL
mmetsp:Transcript_12446/g.33981  ORF Transcript_12446/g.33981 Transcript_12446/m.33981 type:complete len:201 (-) Transcript_12446:1796-2398(-)